ncbi:MAG: hypothetical protein MPJ78_17540 [Hyphomicrobiaceae bacterium]|nr:hypothetical protein [Hyphomicrobiaceae bacterium]
MIRILLSGLTAVAMLVMFADGPAEAQRFKAQGGANATAGNATTGNGGTRSRTRAGRRLSGGQQQPTANTGASIHALGVYLQWREKCLNNLLPRCE